MSNRTKEILVAGISIAVVLFAVIFAMNGSASDGVPAYSDVPVSDSSKGEEGEDSMSEMEEFFSENGQIFDATFDVFDEVPVAAEPSDPVPAVAEPVSSVPAAPVVENNVLPAQQSLPVLARTPAKAPRPAQKNFNCAGQICIDADTGEILSAQNAMVSHPPASVTKLMTIYVVLDAIAAGKLNRRSLVTASQRAQDTGGTQVYLAKGEVNSVDDLLYALMLQSANDAAIALAEKVSGSVEEFVAQMNAKAKALGLTRTAFSTPHGLPMSKKERAAGKKPDMSSAEDLAKLARALIREHPSVFRYSAARTKVFREDRFGTKPLPMGNHNTLLRLFPGCDGLKTGWTNAGASIVTTASRGNRRVIAVVLGGLVRNARGEIDPKTSQRERNQRAAELMFNGLKSIDALKYEPTPQNPKNF